MNTINVSKIIDNNNIKYPIWHPNVDSKNNASNILNVAKGKGVFLYDINNMKYLDASSGFGNVLLGYSNDQIEVNVLKQLSSLSHCSVNNTNLTAIKCATSLLKILPFNMKKIIFLNSNDESVEVAAIIATRFWELNGKSEKRKIFNFANGKETLFCLTCNQKEKHPKCDFKCIQSELKLIKNNSQEIAGVILEPILRSKSLIVIPKKFISELQVICKECSILLIMSEMAIGIYSEGEMFAFNKYNVVPDIICIGKAINNGCFSFGVTAFSSKVMEVCSEFNEMLLDSISDINLLSCAACLSTIAIHKQLDFEIINSNSIYIFNELMDKISNHKNVLGVHNEGIITQIALVKNKKNEDRLKVEHIRELSNILFKNGLIVISSEVGITLLPMLTIRKDEVILMLDIIDYTFKRIYF